MGYWTTVYDRAVQLMREHPEMKGDEAYWRARQQLDREGAQPPLLDVTPEPLLLKS